MCESRGGRPGLPVTNCPHGLCGRRATINSTAAAIRSVVMLCLVGQSGQLLFGLFARIIQHEFRTFLLVEAVCLVCVIGSLRLAQAVCLVCVIGSLGLAQTVCLVCVTGSLGLAQNVCLVCVTSRLGFAQALCPGQSLVAFLLLLIYSMVHFT